jgi:hypothetical protein
LQRGHASDRTYGDASFGGIEHIECAQCGRLDPCLVPGRQPEMFRNVDVGLCSMARRDSNYGTPISPARRHVHETRNAEAARQNSIDRRLDDVRRALSDKEPAVRLAVVASDLSNPFRYFNSSPEVIRLVVMMYVRYPLSLRNVEDLLAERGIDISHETVRFWWNQFGRCSPPRSVSDASRTCAPIRSDAGIWMRCL